MLKVIVERKPTGRPLRFKDLPVGSVFRACNDPKKRWVLKTSKEIERNAFRLSDNTLWTVPLFQGVVLASSTKIVIEE